MSLIYENETWILRRCFFDVQREVGLGRREKAYQQACELWLEENHIPYRAKAPHHLRLRGEIVHTLLPDLVVWDLITVELKALRRKLRGPEFVQILDYLKGRNDRLGLLVNMGLERVEVHRLPYDRPEYDIEEDWQYWTDKIRGNEREAGSEIRDGLRAIFESHGTAYGEEIVQKLIMFELRSRGLSLVLNPTSKTFYYGVEVDESPLDCVLIDGRVLLTFSCLFDDNKLNIGRGKSYLSSLELEWGVAANFGKRTLQITGLHVSS